MIRLFLCEKFLKYLQTGSLLIHDRSENREQLNETEQPDTETEQSEETGISTWLP